MEKVSTCITKVKLNKRTFHNKEFSPTLINFIYGTNGTGKTTITETMLDDDAMEKDHLGDTCSLLIYNEDYIRQNVQSYGNIPGVFTLSQPNANIKKQIDDAAIQQRKASDDFDHASEEIDKNQKHITQLENDTKKKITNSTKTTRDSYVKAIPSKERTGAKIFEKLLTVSPVHHADEELQKLYQTGYLAANNAPAGLYKPVVLKLDPAGLKLLSIPIESKSDTEYARFIRVLHNTGWVRTGHDQYQPSADGLCPYCHQPLPHNFEADFKAAFDKTYEDELNTIRNFAHDFETQADQIKQILQANTGFNEKLDDALRMQGDLLVERLNANVVIINQKLAEPGKKIEFEPLDDLVVQVNETIKQINDEITKYNNLLHDVNDTKIKCTNAVWQEMAFVCKDIISAYNDNLKILKQEDVDIKERQKKAKQEEDRLNNEIKSLNSQTQNTTDAMNAINAMLKNAGFQGFYLEEKPDAQYVYRLVRNDNNKTSVVDDKAGRLSEGERNFIAFLYFYYTVVGNQEGDGIQHDKIIVIDDPVSSMDSGSLFVVASLIRNLINICYNNYELSDRADRSYYVRQIFCLTHNPYFFREITYNRVKDYECVSFFKITKKAGNESDIQLCVKDDSNYSPVKNAYDSLWQEYRFSDDSNIVLNAARRIIEYYFLQTCGQSNIKQEILENHKDEFIQTKADGSENPMLYNIASSLVAWASDTVPSLSDELFFDPSAVPRDYIRNVMQNIFTVLGQKAHYDMMWNRANKQ